MLLMNRADAVDTAELLSTMSSVVDNINVNIDKTGLVHQRVMAWKLLLAFCLFLCFSFLFFCREENVMLDFTVRPFSGTWYRNAAPRHRLHSSMGYPLSTSNFVCTLPY